MAKQLKNKGSETIKKVEPIIPYQRRWGNQFTKAYTDEEIEMLADKLLEWMEAKTENIWYKDFCVENRIGNQRLSEFTVANKYFAWIMGFCKDIQESRMFKLGTSKKTNPAMFILGLKNNHKWTDQPQQGFGEVKELPDFEGKTDDEIDEIINTYQKQNGNGK